MAAPAAAEKNPKVEGKEDSDDDMPELENSDANGKFSSGSRKSLVFVRENLIIVYTNLAAAGGGADAAGKGQSRGEKKSRKALAKHGLKPVPNVNRVTIKKAKGVCSGTITVC